jgi:O-antigen/teichoic acid export membrane protein
MRVNDLGLSTATLQKAQIDHRQISTLFWVNMAAGVLIALVVAALAPALAWFYAEPRLTLITVVSAVLFVFAGLTIQH